MRIFFGVLFFCLNVLPAFSQINLENITIHRDQWGVPHIEAGTDAELAYGLAWATAEDDFNSIQDYLFASRGRFAEVKGKEGAIYDAVCFLVGIREYVEANYEKEIPDWYKEVLSAYIQAINRYAELHPKEVYRKKLFPATEQDLMVGYVLGMMLITNVGDDLTQIFSGEITRLEVLGEPRGSNAIAIAPSKTTNGKSFLAVNSHQPLFGPFSWYEAHLYNDNMNIHGATFPGGTSLFIGANENLGWAHTVNHPDFTDVYKLEMHPEDKLKYRYDGEWKTLEERVIRLKVKVAFLRIPVKRKFYWSEYGPTIKNKEGFYSIRSAAMTEMGHASQWFEMNKATNFEEFHNILQTQRISGTNIVYADKDGHIYYISSGLFPNRSKAYDWTKVLPGNTSTTKWPEGYFPLDSLVSVFDPPSGYVFNTNNGPFNSTGKADNPKPENYNANISFSELENNRSKRLSGLLEQESGKISYDRFKEMKYDGYWVDPLSSTGATNLNLLRTLSTEKYPDLTGLLTTLQNWDLNTDIKSEGGAIMTLFLHFYLTDLYKTGFQAFEHEIEEAKMVEYLRKVRDHLVKHYKTTNVTLGDVQRHIRGDVDLPVAGSPWVLPAVYAEMHKKGRLRITAGESFIQLVQFGPDGPTIETINAYGASAKEDSPHYTDQMQMYVNRQLKPMTLDMEVVRKTAKRSYHPK